MEVVYKMNHEAYIGKSLRELVADCPDYGINFYIVRYRNHGGYLKIFLDNENMLGKRIKAFKRVNVSYEEYIIILED
jgi:hypothetical protein